MIRILLLALVLAGVWYLYRMVTQQKPGAAPLAAPGQEEASPPPAANDAAPGAEPAAEPETGTAGEAEPPRPTPQAAAEDLAECPLCHAYVPERAHDGCGRPDCPIPVLAAAREQPGA